MGRPGSYQRLAHLDGLISVPERKRPESRLQLPGGAHVRAALGLLQDFSWRTHELRSMADQTTSTPGTDQRHEGTANYPKADEGPRRGCTIVVAARVGSRIRTSLIARKLQARPTT